MFIHNWVMIPNIHIPIVKDLQKKYPKELMDRLIDEEEKKYNDMIKQIEQKLPKKLCARRPRCSSAR